MPTAGSFAARIAEVQYSTDDMTYNDLEKLNSPRFSGNRDVAESSSNDSAGEKEYVTTWNDATLSFEMVADENATGQEAIWSSYLAGTSLYYRLRPRGNAAGERQIKFLGIVTSLEESLDKSDVAKYNVTIQKTGAPTRNTQ